MKNLKTIIRALITIGADPIEEIEDAAGRIADDRATERDDKIFAAMVQDALAFAKAEVAKATKAAAPAAPVSAT